MCDNCKCSPAEPTTTGLVLAHEELEAGFKRMLQGLKIAYGLDLKDENLRETPARVARALLEMLQGIDQTGVEEILKKNFPTNYTGMVVLTDIHCFSMCPHHFLPVSYKVNFAYIPQGHALGLSKIPRFIKLLLQAPMLQEDATDAIVDKFNEYVNASGAMVTLSGQHMCMGCRGVSKPEVLTLTSALRGDFKKPEVRAEFFTIVENRK